MKLHYDDDIMIVHGSRSPQGERGLKCFIYSVDFKALKSLPARGARIEITSATSTAARAWVGRSPQGERGLKSCLELKLPSYLRRSPQGERGLKSLG